MKGYNSMDRELVHKLAILPQKLGNFISDEQADTLTKEYFHKILS